MKIKLLTIMLAATCLLSACHDDKADEKAKQAEVFKVHDEVMGISDKLITNKAAIDSLIKTGNTDTTQAKQLIVKLTTADEAMEKWMHTFNPDYTGKSHAQIMDYLTDQHKQILHIDTMIKTAIDGSNKFLKAK